MRRRQETVGSVPPCLCRSVPEPHSEFREHHLKLVGEGHTTGLQTFETLRQLLHPHRRATETDPLLPKRSQSADQMRAASDELVELLELASSSSSPSDCADRVVPLAAFLVLSLDGRSDVVDVVALPASGVGRVGVFFIDE
eukprot:g69464.t1